MIDSDVDFDLMFIDQTLSQDDKKLSGCDVMIKLRRLGQSRTIVIGLTGSTFHNESAMMMSGAKAVWAKPLKPAQDIRDDLKAMFECVSKIQNISFPLFDKIFKGVSRCNPYQSSLLSNPNFVSTIDPTKTAR